jgi:hypothetical protein
MTGQILNEGRLLTDGNRSRHSASRNPLVLRTRKRASLEALGIVQFRSAKERKQMTNALDQNQSHEQSRSLAMSAGHISISVSAELGRLLAANGGDRS